jgi:predicted glutamine amidotransferase
MTAAVSDGERVWAVRYASGPVVNSLFVSADAGAVRELHPENERFRGFSDEAHAIVSEPLTDLPGLWHEIPPGTAFVIQPGEDLRLPFAPRRNGIARNG